MQVLTPQATSPCRSARPLITGLIITRDSGKMNHLSDKSPKSITTPLKEASHERIKSHGTIFRIPKGELQKKTPLEIISSSFLGLESSSAIEN
jgi:hypothetical protein